MKPANILVLDSSTQTLFLGLMQDGVVKGHHLEVLDRRHAEFMLPRIMQFLNRYQLTLNDLTDVVVGHGPGSFTGVRLALTLIKTLALIQPLRVYPISTLQLFAYETKTIISLDARGGRRYVGVFEGQDILLPPQVMTEKDLISCQQNFPQFRVLTIESAYAQPLRILNHLQKLMPHLSPLIDVHALNPLYLKELG
ncbi:MAG: tRNA (adenosine(37)-N6)-threonylcarbamoyltransferase complex dimerization subunit type 1 TsaB [Firmicutes bacterium]|nr:tRNA (adenosine(37)-N6)-threonylcarbamoyltransferase complex dimerization subunit type 1 TsaB [Bacillota bacterium]